MGGMELLVSNISGKVRRETLYGREYLVAPTTLIVPGVLNGSGGPIYYSSEEIVRNARDWNNMPLVVYHPTNNGKPTSARDPSVLNNRGVGFVLNAKGSDDGSLVAESWFEIESTRRVDNRIIDALEDGTNIEISTGLFPQELVPAPEGAVFNDTAYDFEAHGLTPDHLAILPDQTGACSLADGCGVLVNKLCKCSDESNCQCPVMVETSDSDGFKHNCIVHRDGDEWLVANEMSHGDLHSALSKELSSKFTQDEPGAWISEVFDDFIIYWQGDDLYKLSYSKSDGSVSLGSETPQKVIRETNFVVANEENDSMADKKLVDQVIANCSCWEEGDKEVLNSFPEEKLKGFLAMEKKANDQPVANDGGEGDKTDPTPTDPPTTPPVQTAQSTPTANGEEGKTPKEQTPEEYLAAAPPAIANALRNAIQIEADGRANIISQLVANVTDETQKASAQAVYESLGFEQLKTLAATAVTPTVNQQAPAAPSGSLASYFGQGGAPPVVNRAAPSEADHLPLPTINWSDKAAN